MKRIVRLTENDLTRIVKRVLKEQRLEDQYRNEGDILKLIEETSKKFKSLPINANIYKNENQTPDNMVGKGYIGQKTTDWGGAFYFMRNSDSDNELLNPESTLSYQDFQYHCKNNEFKTKGYKFKIGYMESGSAITDKKYYDLYYKQESSGEPSIVTDGDKKVYNKALLEDLKQIFHDFFNKLNVLICRKPSTGGDNRYAQINNRSNTNNSNIA